MIEKVLRGFYEEDIESEPNWFKYTISKDKLVSVRLVSESVDLKWLEWKIKDMAKDSEVEIHIRNYGSSKEGYKLALNNLLVSIRAEKEAKKNE